MGAHRSVICLGALSAFLAVVCVVLAALLIWREIFVDSSTRSAEGPTLVTLNTTNQTEIRQKFPGYFRTLSEQQALIQANPIRPVPVSNVSRVHRRCFTDGYCELQQSNVTTRTTTTTTATATTTATTTATIPRYLQEGPRVRRQISGSPECELDVFDKQDLFFHGCCVSYSQLAAPSSLQTAEPGMSGSVQVAQFPALRQFFEVQLCCQAKSCSGCQCSQTYYVVTAVVAQSTPTATLYGIGHVLVPGCCKCLNISPPPAGKEVD